jgi:hypothetical protein
MSTQINPKTALIIILGSVMASIVAPIFVVIFETHYQQWLEEESSSPTTQTVPPPEPSKASTPEPEVATLKPEATTPPPQVSTLKLDNALLIVKLWLDSPDIVTFLCFCTIVCLSDKYFGRSPSFSLVLPN